jgi:hypothetical protein
LFTVELDRRLARQGVRAYAVHPGVIMTELSRHMTEDDYKDLQSRGPTGGMQFKPVEAGAATTVWAATAPELADVGGLYLEDCHVGVEASGPQSPEGHAAYAVDRDAAGRLWTWSEAEVGQQFPLGA